MSPDVLEYLEYREYLRDWFAESKRQNRFTSYRYLARKTGLDAGWLARIFQREGHLSEEYVPTFLKLCALDERRSEYFRVLHRFCRTKSPDEQKDCYRRLLELREIEARPLEAAELNYFSQWSTTALRALIGISSRTQDIAELAAKLEPAITPAEAQVALEVLRKLALIREDGKGGWDITDRILTTGAEVRSGAVRQFHRTMLELAAQSLERHATEERDISSITLTLDHEDMEEVKARVAEFRKGLLQFARSSGLANRVYNLTIAFFPLSGVVQDVAAVEEGVT